MLHRAAVHALIGFSMAALLLFMPSACAKVASIGGKERQRFYTTAVSISPGATEIVLSRANFIKVLGRTEYCNYPYVPRGSEVVMSGVKPNYEKIAGMRPELVFYDPDLFTEDEIAKFKEIGIETFALGGNTVDEFIDRLYRFGTLIGVESSADTYAREIETAIASASGAPPDPKPKVAVLLPGQGTEHMIAGTRSFLADIVRKSGGDPVGPDSVKFETLNAESLIAWNPDAIVCPGSADAILKDSRLQAIKAVSMRNLGPIHPDILLRKGNRVHHLIRGLYQFLSGVAHRMKEAK